VAGSSLFALIDDIASLLDDISVMTKVAAKKTAGVLGDDLALNAQQVSGVQAERELPVVWAVAKGSIINKLILVPLALLISAFIPWLVTPLLMVGGAYLCFEGFEKLAHKFLHSKQEDDAHHAELVHAVNDQSVDMVAYEKQKIAGAIRTDFILSAEIIIIALGTLQAASRSEQIAVLSTVALLMTVGVYGLVAGIVKLDDAGLRLLKVRSSGVAGKLPRALGAGLLALAPKLLKFLSVAGTAAMFLVGGSIVLHGLPTHDVIHAVVEGVSGIAVIGGFLTLITPMLLDGIAGIVVGAIVLALVTVFNRIRTRKTRAENAA
jgi:predicted DNA repair protein MutK